MITALLAKVFGTANIRQLKRLAPIVQKINELEASVVLLTNDELRAKTDYFRQQYQQGRSLDDMLPEAFSVVREAAKRQLGQRHYDVQLMGGIVLHEGKISEMKTGEGKTLTATLALYLNALSGKGAHLVTVNDYLARRDAEWMQPVYELLGLSVGVLQNSMSDQERKEIYNCDVVYATNNELGFDYLRDNMKYRLEDYVQRELNFAIVDEVDSILIDEARTPLIISGAADKSSDMYIKVDKVVRRLNKSTDYQVDEKERSVHLTESGVDAIEHAFNIQNLYALDHLTLVHHVQQALRAHALFKRDVEYVIRDNELMIVDEFTGRILPGRRYSDGLHQALEAKEGVEIERESQTLASITLQNFFRLYKKLAGMTGTAQTEAEEFHRIYGLDVVSIPTNKKLVRQDKPDLIFLSQQAKYKAIAKDIMERYKKGQPVLIGTIAVEASELLSNVLSAHNIPHEVLNAKQHAREAEIIAKAGQEGHITIATNMAGRGTDIKLTPGALAKGGLYILGTERHESRRIDNQLRGRSGRQGDEGESRFYISLEDNLIRIFGGETIKKRMEMVGMTEDETIESSFISKNIESSQQKVEKHNFDIRKNTLEYDDVLNQQRKVIYTYRRDILEGGKSMAVLVSQMIEACISDFLNNLCSTEALDAHMHSSALDFVAQLTGIDRSVIEQKKLSSSSKTALKNDLINFLNMEYQLSRSGIESSDMMAQAEQWLMIETIDQAWKNHMLNLDHLKEGIGLRGWGQKNPLIEYKKEAFSLFQEMIFAVRWDIVHRIFHINLKHFDQAALEQKRQHELDHLELNNQQEDSPAVKKESTGRNEQCSCGSGKKYKKCCGLKAR